jgi:beta-glucanase (GH16 family)
MPAGCGTWPAFWLVNDDPNRWPYDGEIDIVEGVNEQDKAKVSEAIAAASTCILFAPRLYCTAQ